MAIKNQVIVWTPEKDEILKDNLSKMGTRKLGIKLGMSKTSVLKRCKVLGLSEILQENSEKSLLKEGNTMRKGKKISPEQYEKMKPNMFKKGMVSHKKKEIGSKRPHKDGYSLIKTEDGYQLEHRVIWESIHGKVPEGHVIILIDKDKSNISPENLECISKDEHTVRNFTIGDYPRDIQKLEYTAIRLKRKLQKIYEQK